jgi:hypothetical protein
LFFLFIIIAIVLFKGTILANPKGIVWNQSKTKARISEWGLKAGNPGGGGHWVFATEGYAISGNFPSSGTIVFYFEVTMSGW